MIKKYIIGSAFATFALVGCGSSTTTDTALETTGYLVDSAVQNVNYDCVSDNDYNKTTGIDGAFTCRTMNQVRFRIGDLVLGEIDALPQDGYVCPQDLVGVDRTNISDPKVTAMAQLLQSLDSDGNVSNGLQIPEDTHALFENTEFNASDLEPYLESASIEPARIRTETEAREHLRDTMQDLHIQTGIKNGDSNRYGDQNTTNSIERNNTAMSTLTEELKYTIAYMWNEEKLAKDIYLALNEIYPTQQLENIATNAETQHQNAVEELVQKYDINITNLEDYTDNYSEAELRAFAPGEFAIQEIKDLYDALYAKGSQSQQDALEVGCMVEVTDVNDLNEDIFLAEESNASDLVAVFSSLRDGSYNHYWAFDRGLKNMGIIEGCCSLGTIDGIDYCQPDYPQNSHGN